MRIPRSKFLQIIENIVPEESETSRTGSGQARTDMNRVTDDGKDADPDIPELIEARERLGELKREEDSRR